MKCLVGEGEDDLDDGEKHSDFDESLMPGTNSLWIVIYFRMHHNRLLEYSLLLMLSLLLLLFIIVVIIVVVVVVC